MEKDFDQQISELFNQVKIKEANSTLIIPFYTVSLPLLIPSLYSLVKRQLKKKSVFNFKKIYKIIKYCAFYLLWSIKWFVLFGIIKNKNIYLTSLMDRGDSYKLVNLILNEFDCKIIQYGILTKFKLLFSNNIFCVPHFFLKQRIINVKNVYLDQIKNISSDLQQTINKIFKINTSQINLSAKIITGFINIHFIYKKIISQLQKTNKINIFISDRDFSSFSVVFINLCKQNKIPTIGIQHAIFFYEHLYKSVYSDYQFVWGKQNYERIIKGDNNNSKIIIIGKNIQNNVMSKPTPADYWVYCLSAYDEPFIQTINRNLDDSLSLCDIIEGFSKKNNKKLLIRPHPSDMELAFPKKFSYSYKKLDKTMAQTELFFIEDTSLIIDLLIAKKKFIYILNEANQDPLNLQRFGFKYLLKHTQNAEPLIKQILQEKPDDKIYKNILDYFIQNNVNTNNEIKKSISVIIA
ncbi:MAG: hypothetical protein V1773_15380 [bacterium]